MVIKTDEEFKNFFRDDYRCRMFLKEQLWFDVIICPSCGYDKKIYTLSNGVSYKCGNPECHKKFTATSNTIFDSIKLKLPSLFLGIWYMVKAGRSANELDFALATKQIPTQSVVAVMFDKIQLLLIDIEKYNRNHFDIFKDVIRNIKNKSKFSYHFKSENYKPWYLIGIDDISQRLQYERVVKYARRRILSCKWIYVKDFVNPEEVVTECWLRLEKDNIREYNSHFIATMINRSVNKLWYDFVKSNPKMYEDMLKKGRYWKQQAVFRLKDYYIRSLIYKSTDLKWSEITDPEIIENARKKIKEKREKWGRNDLNDYKNEVQHLMYL